MVRPRHENMEGTTWSDPNEEYFHEKYQAARDSFWRTKRERMTDTRSNERSSVREHEDEESSRDSRSSIKSLVPPDASPRPAEEAEATDDTSSAAKDLKIFYTVKFTRRKEDGSWEPQKLTVGVPEGSMADKLREAVAVAAGVNESCIVMGASKQHDIHRFFDDKTSLDFMTATSTSILCYEVKSPEAFIFEEHKHNDGMPRPKPVNLPEAAVVLYFGKIAIINDGDGQTHRSNVLIRDPVCFYHQKQTSPARIYENVADLIGVPGRTDLFKLFVCNTFGEPDGFHQNKDMEINRNETRSVNRGLRAKVYLLVSDCVIPAAILC